MPAPPTSRTRSTGAGVLGRQRRAPGGAFAFLSVVLVASPVAPEVITVGGACYLADAIRAANSDTAQGGCLAGSGADTIVLTGDVVLNAVEQSEPSGDSGLPIVASEMTIDGGGHTIRRDPAAAARFRVLTVMSLGNLTLKNTTVSGGDASQNGGAIFNNGRVRIVDSTITGNHADFFGGAILSTYSLEIERGVFSLNQAGTTTTSRVGGGAIKNTGQLQVVDSTFDQNQVGSILDPPGFGYGGALANTADATVVGSTFSRNSVQALATAAVGSAIWDLGGMAISNSTFSGNGHILAAAAAIESVGAGLAHVTLSGNRYLALASLDGSSIDADATIIANTGGDNCSGQVSGLNSVADDETCGTIPGNLVGLDPVLADHGGSTLTHALLAGSNAIDGAGSCGTPEDQRGAPRVGVCDIGAFEYLGCPELEIDGVAVEGEETWEECAVSVGPAVVVLGPHGDLTIRYGGSARFASGFSVELGGRLTVAHDGALSLRVADPRRRR